MFHTATAEEIISGKVTDIYFERTRQVLQAKKSNEFDLLLIGRRQLRSNNSWMHNSRRLVKGKERCTLLMHPDDARAREITEGQTVAVHSRTGRVEIFVEITEAMMPGVVSMPHGWGHNRPGIRLQTASAHAGVSLNDLTDEQAIDAVSGNAAFSGVPVDVVAVGEKVAAPVPS